MIYKRPLSKRELNLIKTYSDCKLGMTPQRFYRKWNVSHNQIAQICNRSVSNVSFWFSIGRNQRNPTSADLRHLALMDFLLEHFEEIPETLTNLLCPPTRGD
jgi:hypothetical protein